MSSTQFQTRARNELTVTIGDVTHTFFFVTGGILVDPRKAMAYRGQGVVTSGHYDEFTLEGTVRITKEMIDFLNGLCNKGVMSISTAAVYRQYVTVSPGIERIMKFGNCRLAAPVVLNVEADGGGSGFDVTVSFSLNDLIEEPK